jgi:hypothetical protein
MSIGMVLIAVAIILLLGKLGVFGFLLHMLWPILILAGGLILHWLYFNRTLPAGVLVPGGILITYSLMFLFCNVFGWGAMSYLWPGFIFGVAVGLYEFYFFERHTDRSVLVASIVIGAVAAVFFGLTVLAKLGIYFIAIVLVIAGLLLIWRRPRTW